MRRKENLTQRRRVRREEEEFRQRAQRSEHRAQRREPKSTGRSACATGVGQTQERSPGWLCHGWDFGFGNREEDGLVRGAEFVMIWTFLVSRGNSAADCS